MSALDVFLYVLAAMALLIPAVHYPIARRQRRRKMLERERLRLVSYARMVGIVPLPGESNESIRARVHAELSRPPPAPNSRPSVGPRRGIS